MKKFMGFLFVLCALFCTSSLIGDAFFLNSLSTANCQNLSNNFQHEVSTFSAEAASLNSTYIVSANSAVVFAEADFSSEKIATLAHKDEIVVLTDDDVPVTEFWNEFKFFKINLKENGIENENFDCGYVVADLLTPKQEEIVAIPNFNAKTNKECHVFSQENGKFVENETILTRGQQIFLYEGFDAKKDFTAISFVLDGKVLYGFLKTDDISPNGINPLLITCTVLIVAMLSIIFAWLFMKNKHVRLKKQKHGQYDLKSEK